MAPSAEQHQGVAKGTGVTAQRVTIEDKLRTENFPVALRILPRRFREHLTSVYGFARTVDDLGDESSGDRSANLDSFAADLATIWTGGTPATPVLGRLAGTVRACDLPAEPFRRLVEANRQDQRVTAYPTYAGLRAYCALSADPVGRIVLGVFGVATDARVAWSDAVCTALQLVEHWQDVAEDRRAGRVYLPVEDMTRFGVTPADLDGTATPDALRRLLAFETDRAAGLLRQGAPLVRDLRGWARLAVGGFLAGGLATVDALRRADYDVLARTPRPRRIDVMRHLIAEVALPLPEKPRMTTTLAEAYRECEDITRNEARNFYYGIRLLPPDKRAVLCAVYALARRMDDIGDGDLPAEAKVSALAGLRAALASLSTSTDPVLVAVADAARRYPIPLEAFGELVDGVEMDVTGRRYATFDELVTYCRCVAGAVGRLCLGVFGSTPHPDAARYADQLGIALQQTNILRDVREDLINGRTYLPREELDRYGVELALDERGALIDQDGALTALIRDSCRRARDWYRDGLRLAPLLDWRSKASCLAMAGIYRQLLSRIEAEPSLVFGGRLSLSGREKIQVAVRSLAGRTS